MRKLSSLLLVLGGLLSLGLSMEENSHRVSRKCAYRHTKRPAGYRADCSRRNLTQIPTNLLRNITYLDLRHNDIETLPARAFSALSHLKTVSLGYNLIIHVDPLAFVGMKNLTVLLLNDNKISITNDWCETGPFNSAPNLRNLNLQRNFNPETGYPEDCVSNLTNLEKLSIEGINNASFGPGFANLKILTTLNMEKSIHLTSLGQNVFRNLQNLSIRILKLSHCNLQVIDKRSFYFLHKLTSLDLRYNTNLGIRSMSMWVMGLRKPKLLRKLAISHICKPDGETIVVRKTYFRYLQKTAVEELDMAYNMIAKFDPGARHLLPQNLKTWKLVGNHLTGFKYMQQLYGLSDLETFDARNQHSNTLTPETPILADLNETTNKTHDLAETNIQRLKYIHLPPSLSYFRLTHSSGFSIKRTLLSFAPNVLKYLDLCCNKFGKQFMRTSGLEGVEYLDLSRNQLDVKPGFFDGLSGLADLNLASNFIGIALKHDNEGELFKPLRNLVNLSLSTNNIGRMSANAFASMSKLHTLILSDNKLENLDARIGHMYDLKLLDLRNNNIQYLSDDTISDLEELSRHTDLRIRLSNNNLICNCDSLHFLEWAISSYHQTVELSPNLTCKRNKSSTPVPLGNLDDTLRELQSRCTTYVALILAVSMAILGSLLVVVVALVYRYRWKLRYLYYIARMQWKGKKNGYTSLDGQNDDEFEFDVFVSYADEDRSFVVNEMRKVLENDNNFRLCIHHRDFLVGDEIAANITRAIHGSRRTVVLLSDNFIKSYWCMYEFQMARMEAIYTGRDVLLVIMYDSVSSMDMPYEVLNVIQSQSYLERPRHSDLNDSTNIIQINENSNSISDIDMTVFWDNLVASIKCEG